MTSGHVYKNRSMYTMPGFLCSLVDLILDLIRDFFDLVFNSFCGVLYLFFQVLRSQGGGGKPRDARPDRQTQQPAPGCGHDETAAVG